MPGCKRKGLITYTDYSKGWRNSDWHWAISHLAKWGDHISNYNDEVGCSSKAYKKKFILGMPFCSPIDPNDHKCNGMGYPTTCGLACATSK